MVTNTISRGAAAGARLTVTCIVTAAVIGCAHDEAHRPAAPLPAASAVATKASSARPPGPPAAGPTRREPGDDAIFFDFDSAALRDDARSALQKLATDLPKDHDGALVIEGNCDELGTVEYNLALGEERARSAKQYLSRLGVPPARIRTVSYGSQRPKYAGHDDASRAKNRRDDIRVQ